MDQTREKPVVSSVIENEIKHLKAGLDFQTFAIAREAEKTRATIWIACLSTGALFAAAILSPYLLVPLLVILGLCMVAAIIGKRLGIASTDKNKP